MATLSESATWVAGIYQLETTDPVLGGPDGIDNLQAKQLANRTLWLKGQVESLGTGKQPLDATLTALAGVTTEADRLIYANGPDSFGVTPLTAFIRTLLDDADAATARATLGAAPVASPTFSGTPTAPTAAPGTNTLQLANTAFVQATIAALVASSPAALDTLNELAAALGNDPNFATTVTNELALKASLVSPGFTGNPTAPTPAQFDNDTSLATTEFVQRSLGSRSGYVSFTASQTLTLAYVGGYVRFDLAAAANCTLPAPNTVPAGSSIIVQQAASSSAVLTVKTPSGTIGGPGVNGASGITQLVMQAGSVAQIEFVSDGVSSWVACNGSYGASLTAAGYQRLPSGLIIQWGSIALAAYSTINQFQNTPFVFPQAFPNAVYSIGASIVTGIAQSAFTNVSIENRTKSGATAIYSSSQAMAGAVVTYLAVGN